MGHCEWGHCTPNESSHANPVCIWTEIGSGPMIAGEVHTTRARRAPRPGLVKKGDPEAAPSSVLSITFIGTTFSNCTGHGRWRGYAGARGCACCVRRADVVRVAREERVEAGGGAIGRISVGVLNGKRWHPPWAVRLSGYFSCRAEELFNVKLPARGVHGWGRGAAASIPAGKQVREQDPGHKIGRGIGSRRPELTPHVCHDTQGMWSPDQCRKKQTSTTKI